MEKQLLTVNQEEAREKANRGEALTLKELAVVIGMSYGSVRSWTCGYPSLPLLNGKVFFDDFVLWRRRKSGLELSPAAVASLARQGAGKFGESVLTHD